MASTRGPPALVACAASCLDVPAKSSGGGPQFARAPGAAVLGAIDNLPAATATALVRSPQSKKQRLLAKPGDQGPPPLDAAALFAQARALLRQLPAPGDGVAPCGREQQYQQIQEALAEFTTSGRGSSVYVSGLPGTGKSHTVRKALAQLQQEADSDSPAVTWINCMSVTSAGEVFAQIADAAGRTNSSGGGNRLRRQHDSPDSPDSDDDGSDDAQHAPFPAANKQLQPIAYQQLLQCLRAAGPRLHGSGSRPAPKSYRAGRQPATDKGASGDTGGSTTPPPAAAAGSAKPSKGTKRGSSGDGTPAPASSLPPQQQQQQQQQHIVVLDEIDSIAKRSVAELVRLFLLPHEPGLALLLVGIANCIDLTERALPQLRLQLATPRLITFPAYSAAQLAGILEGAAAQLPCKLFEAAALQLCSRSVAASTGDLRHALKACRAAVDELEQQQQLAAADAAAGSDATAAPGGGGGVRCPTIGARHMSAALSRLASVRSSQFGAQACSIIRSLPNQQQLLLYALSVLCQQPSEGGEAGDGASAAASGSPAGSGKQPAGRLWKAAGTAAMVTSGGSPAAGGGGGAAGGGGGSFKLSGGPSALSGGGGSGVFVLAVGVEDVFAQYLLVTKLLKLPACSRGELLHMAELLSQMALVDVIRAPPPAAGAPGSAKKGCSPGGAAGGGGFKGFRGAAASKLGGLAGGSRGGLKKLGGGGGRSAGSASGAGQQGEARLSLRASSAEVAAALKANPALRCLVDS